MISGTRAGGWRGVCISAALLALTGCNAVDSALKDRIGEEIFAPPNGGRTEVSADDIQAFNPDYYQAAYTVSVGPPHATLAYWRADPTRKFLKSVIDATTGDTKGIANEVCGAQVRNPEVRGTAIVLHGWGRYTALNYTDMQRIQTLLLCGGWRIIAVDQRGFGLSTGSFTSHGVYEAHDIKQLVDDLQRRKLLNPRLIILGHSYGAAVARQAAAIDRRVRAVIALSGPKDLFSTGPALRAVAKKEHPILFGLTGSRITDDLFRSAVREAAAQRGFDPSLASAEKAARKLRIPFFIAQGERDENVPASNGKALAAANPRFATLWLGPNDDHWSYRDNLEFRLHLRDWLTRMAPPKP